MSILYKPGEVWRRERTSTIDSSILCSVRLLDEPGKRQELHRTLGGSSFTAYQLLGNQGQEGEVLPEQSRGHTARSQAWVLGQLLLTVIAGECLILLLGCSWRDEVSHVGAVSPWLQMASLLVASPADSHLHLLL